MVNNPGKMAGGSNAMIRDDADIIIIIPMGTPVASKVRGVKSRQVSALICKVRCRG